MFVVYILVITIISRVKSDCFFKNAGGYYVELCADSILYKNCSCKNQSKTKMDCRIEVRASTWKVSDIREIEVLDEMKELGRFALKHLNNLEQLRVSSTGLEQIHPASFINVSNIEHLFACSNKIKRISYGIFTAKAFKTITLQGNRIKEIDVDAFGYMTRLYRVDLTDNRLTFINKNWFYESPKIKHLYFDFNFITVVEAGTFENLPKLNTLNLNFNQIHTIENNVFKGIDFYLGLTGNNLTNIDGRHFGYNISIRYLDLEMNRITSLSESFKNSVHSITQLKLLPNPLLCHCMMDIWKWAKMKQIILPHYYNDSKFEDDSLVSLPTCIFPEIVTVNICNNNNDDEENTRLGIEEYFNIVQYPRNIIVREC